MFAIAKKIKSAWQGSMLHRAMLVAPPVGAILLVWYWGWGSRPPVSYYPAKVEKGEISQVVQATGTINAVTTVQVGSQVSGTIAELSADFNSRVKKGQVVAQIDPAIFRTRLLQGEADLENAQANVKSLEAQLETQRADVQASKASLDRARAQSKEAEINLRRHKELFDQGIVAAAQLDTVQANTDAAVASTRVAEAQVEQAQARLKAMRAQLEQARAQVAQRRAAAEMARVDLGHTTIRAPIDGTVIARNVDVGQTVAASLQAPTLFIIAQDLTKMLVYAKTDEADVGKIKVEAMATFRVDSFPRELFRGKVTQVRMNATTVQNVVTYDTILEFDNPGQRLFPGMTAYVTIPIAWASDVIKIPNGALRFKPEIPEEKLKALYEKQGIPYEDPRARRMTAGGIAGGMRSGEVPASGRAGSNGGEGTGTGRPEGPRRMMGGEFGQGRGREQWGVVWKLEKDKKTLTPYRVKLGVTDFTFTEMKEGKLNVDDELVIGQSSGRSPSAQPGGMPGRGGPMGPGGMPRRM